MMLSLRLSPGLPSRRAARLCVFSIGLLAGLILLPALAAAQSVQLNAGVTLSNGGLMPADFCTADVNRDGDLEMVVSFYGKDYNHPGGLYWYKGPQMNSQKIWSPEPLNWITGFAYIAVDDFNNDGKMDMAGLGDQQFRWIPSIADPNTTKTIQRIMVLPDVNRCSMATADLNKDGYVDIVGAFYDSTKLVPNNLFWFENGKGTNPSFTKLQIPSVITDPGLIIADDMNRDGNLDIILEGRNGTALYLNNGAKPPVFTEDVLTTDSRMMEVIDINGDGNPDIIASFKGTLLWLENLGGNSPKFIRHAFSDRGLAYMKFCDLDQDGDLDIAGVKYEPSSRNWSLAYLENQGGWPPSYQEHILKALDYPVTQLQIAPLGPNHRWQYVVGQWNNLLMEPAGWITIYDTIVTPRTGIKGGLWNQYH